MNQEERLRALRLWHWKECQRFRVMSETFGRDNGVGKHYEKWANFHLEAVQTLNDYFPSLDTAEKDVAQ